jgi:hypothetical protein
VNNFYLETARMLIRVAPYVFDDTVALKGGTAINLFFRNMPRLSVDLDLTFLDHTLPRSQALASIDQTLRTAEKRLIDAGYDVALAGSEGELERRLFVTLDRVRVAVEVNQTIRGTVAGSTSMPLAGAAAQTLGLAIDLPVVSEEDVYGGKLVAAFDRQHPRDLFDVVELFANQGLTPGICQAFVVYLASHDRPMHEVLFAREKNIEAVYESAFVGMTTTDVPLDDLLAARARLMRELPAALTREHRDFLISLADANPAWELLDVPHAAELPAIRWKLKNLQILAQGNPRKLAAQRDELERRLNDVPLPGVQL